MKIIVIGAGLGGLSAAIALRKKGHDVVVFEAVKQLIQAGAGIQIPPAATRILKNWNLDHRLRPHVCEPAGWSFRRYQDDVVLGTIPMNPYSEQNFGAPWWSAHRADYQQLLYDVALELGATIHLDCRVMSTDVQTPSVTIQIHGKDETHYADLIVGADGLRSATRAAILSDQDVPINLSTICAYRALVPAEIMLNDPALAKFMKDGDESYWLSPGHNILAYPIRQGPDALYNLVLLHPEKDEHTTHNLPSRFPRPAFVHEVESHFANFTSDVRNIVKVIRPEAGSDFFLSQMSGSHRDGILEWKLGDLPPLPAWSPTNGKVVLIGDAAHATKPHMSSGAAMAVEDAVALAEFLDPRILATCSLPELVTEFERLRKPRTSVIQEYSASDADTWTMEDGSGQQRRDDFVRTLSGNEDASAKVAARLKADGIGSFNFGDPSVLRWLSSYDVQSDAKDAAQKLARSHKSSI